MSDDLRTLEEVRRWLRKMYLDGRDMQLCAIELDAVHGVLVRFDALVKRAEQTANCGLCAGKGYLEVHKSGMTHYETDAGEVCPPYHFERIACSCKGESG